MEPLKEQLYRLMGDREDYFSLKICATLDQSAECHEDAERLRHFILAVPDMIRQMEAWGESRDPFSPLPLARRTVSAYVSKRRNLISHGLYGLFGHLPDAIFTARVYRAAMEGIDPARWWVKRDTRDIAKQIPVWLSLAEKVVPLESRKVEKLLARLIKRSDREALRALLPSEAMSPGGSP